MDTRLEREEWGARFGRLNEEYEGVRVRVEVVNEELGDQEVADGLPLVGLDVDRLDGLVDSIMIVVGQGEERVTHTVDDPSDVWLHFNDEGRLESLAIRSEEEGQTIVTLLDKQA